MVKICCCASWHALALPHNRQRLVIASYKASSMSLSISNFSINRVMFTEITTSTIKVMYVQKCAWRAIKAIFNEHIWPGDPCVNLCHQEATAPCVTNLTHCGLMAPYSRVNIGSGSAVLSANTKLLTQRKIYLKPQDVLLFRVDTRWIW